MLRKTNREKAEKHIAKGDRHLERGKPQKALSEYRKAHKLNPECPGLYDRLIKVKEQMSGDWDMEDFAETVSWTMEKQAQENPAIKQVHAKLGPEWKHATELALRILTDPADKFNSNDVEELVGMGEVATRALIGVLLDIKQATSPESERPEEVRECDDESTESPTMDDVLE